MRAIQEWLVSWGTPGAMVIAALIALLIPVLPVLSSLSEATSTVVTPEYSERMLDRITSQGGAVVISFLGMLMFAFIGKLLLEMLRNELAKKDETITKLIDKLED